MRSFSEWLEQMGLSHCGQVLRSRGIDFESAGRLTPDSLHRLGLSASDSERLLKALAARVRGDGEWHADMAQDTSPVPTPPHASQGEKRPLTVVFCDLVGYTRVCQRLVQENKLEELVEVKRSYVGACAEVVARYEGSIAQVFGDGVMIYFGSPTAHEDDAERGVRTALEIVQAVKGASAAEPLAVRVGIATGLVVVGAPSGAGIGDAGLAVGDTPNLAQRFQSMAGVNEIVIGHDTRRLVGDAFELTDLGALTLKGIDEPLRAWRAHGVRRAAGRFQAAHGGAPLTRPVGRQDEIQQLMREWHLARGGVGRAVVITGEPGIGKSRLTEMLLDAIADEPHATVRFQCSPFHLNAPLSPVIERAEFAAGFARDDSPDQKLDKLEATLVGSQAQRDEAAPLLAALLSLPTERYSSLGLSAARQKDKILDVLIGQLETLSRTQPVVTICEDAHWVDPTSRQLLDALMEQLPVLPVLLVVTSRPQPFARRWTESAHVTTLTLTGLAPHQSVELAGHVARGKALPADVIEQLVARADGVPLYIEELTRSVLESRLLLEEADRYTLREPLPALAIPTTLSALLVARLGRREGVRELAQIGACIGRVFSYELLAAVSSQHGSAFDEELEELTKTDLVFRRGTPPDATYTFKHALVQDAAYDSLLKPQRQRLHEQIANALEGLSPQSMINEPELLAHHRTQANDLRAAIPLWRRAGEAALARVALQEAVAYLEKGLALVERLAPSADRDRLELSLREPLHSARLRWRGWGRPEVGVNAASILWLAERQGHQQSLLVGLWGMWINTITQGRVAETPDWARRLLDEGTQNSDIDLLILGHRALLSSHFYLGALPEALEQRRKVLALYDPARAGRWMELTGNDVRTAVGVFSSQALWMLGYPDQAMRTSDEKDADSRRLGHPFDIGWALTWGTYVFDYRCEPDRQLARIGEADRLGREQSIPIVYKVLVPMVEGLAMLRTGQLPGAIASLRRGIDGWRETGGHLNLPYLKSALAEALARQGDIEASLHLLEECLDQIERPGWHERVWLAEILRLKGWVLMRGGRGAEAEAPLRASIEWARRQQAKSWELRSSTTLAEWLIERGQRNAARELLAPIYNWFTEGFDTHDLRTARTLLDDLG